MPAHHHAPTPDALQRELTALRAAYQRGEVTEAVFTRRQAVLSYQLQQLRQHDRPQPGRDRDRGPTFERRLDLFSD